MTDPRLEPLLDAIAANIAAAVLAELRTGIPETNEAGRPLKHPGLEVSTHAIYHDDDEAA